jgi:hypothetical protein
LIACQAWAEKPFLWRVDAGAQKPSYLFGSIHIPTPAVTNLAPSVEQALQTADAVYCELAFEAATLQKIAQVSMGATQPLSQALPPELYARTETEIKRIVPGFKLAALERAEIWTVGFTLAMLEYQVRYPAVPPLDVLLYQRAKTAGKEAGGLETAEEQLEAMNSFTVAEQIDMLRAALDDMEAMRRRGQSPVERLLMAYRSGDEAAVDREVERSFEYCSPALQKRFEQSLLIVRNRRMAERITEKLRSSPSKRFLFVVGAMHGLGKDSVVDLLSKSGVKVERVTH